MPGPPGAQEPLEQGLCQGRGWQQGALTLDVWPPEQGEKELLLMRPPVCGHAEQPEAPGVAGSLTPRTTCPL